MLGKIIAAKIASKLFEGSKNTVANGLRQNMGSIGGFVADRMQREKTDNEHTTKTKKSETIPGQTETKINPKASTTLDEVAKQVQSAVGVTVNTTKKGFVFVGKHMDGFSNEVSRSLESLGNLLNRLLYLRNKRPTSSPLSFFQEKKKKDDDGGMDWLSILGALYSARKIIRFLKNGKLLSRLLGGGKFAAEALTKPSILKGLLGPALFFGGRIAGPLGVALSAFDFINAAKRDPNKETASDIFWDYAGPGLAGAAAGATAGSLAGPIGTAIGALLGAGAGLGSMFLNRSFRQTGSVSSLEVNKIVFDADKIKFDIVNTLEFKQRVPDSGSAKPVKSAGFFNDLADKYILGGRGSAGSFNSSMDDWFGVGQKNMNRKAGGHDHATSTQKTKPLENPAKVDTTKAPKGLAEQRGIKGKANFMHGQYGDVGENLTTITLNSGKKVTVNKASAEGFLGFLNELEASGYKIDDLQGFSKRGKRKGGGWSQHAYGNAIDINPSKNQQDGTGRTDMPANIRDMAAKYGLSWGGDWSRKYNDPMHFEWNGLKTLTPEQLKELEKPKTQAQPMSFANISPLDNDAASSDKTIPWWSSGSIFSRKDDWSWMRKSSNIDDRRNQPNPYKDDQYSIATKESDANFNLFMTYMDLTTNKIPEATLLGKQLGTDLLTPKPPPPPTLKPPTTSYKDKDKSIGKQSFYQDNDLDHRTEKRVKETRTFANYFSTANNTEDA